MGETNEQLDGRKTLRRNRHREEEVNSKRHNYQVQKSKLSPWKSTVFILPKQKIRYLVDQEHWEFNFVLFWDYASRYLWPLVLPFILTIKNFIPIYR
jgi:hypothetical protein